jgi:hypothetical protein
MQRIVSVRPLEGYELEIAFSDGTRRNISLKDRLFEPLRDVSLFQQIIVDEYGAVCWPNGADLAPDALYEQLRATAPAPARGRDN